MMKRALNAKIYRGYSVFFIVCNCCAVFYALLCVLVCYQDFRKHSGHTSLGYIIFNENLEGVLVAIAGLLITTFLTIWFHKCYTKKTACVAENPLETEK